MQADGTFRLFLAIDPPDGINREIAMIQSRLQRIVTGDVRWVKPGGVHLTLKFFGDVPAKEIEPISAASLKAAAVAAPFTLSFRELAESKAYEAGQFTATELCLFKSELAPGGAIYTKLAVYPFAGSAEEQLPG